MGRTNPGAGAGRPLAGAAALAAALCLAAGAALAQGGIKVRVPDLSGLSKAEARALLQELARVNVITSNCPGWEITPGEWMLLTATGDMLAARLGLDPSVHDRRYFGRAFELLDDPRNCDRIGPEARPLLQRLQAMGGSTKPVATGPAAARVPTAKPADPRKPAANRGRGSGKGDGGNSGKGGKDDDGKDDDGKEGKDDGGNSGKGGGKEGKGGE